MPRHSQFDNLWQSLHAIVYEHLVTPELESAVKAKVASGLYNNASEIIREALRESLRRENENQWLQREAAIGFAQLEAGQVVRVNSKKEFLAAARKNP